MNTDRFNKILAVTIAVGLVVAATESYVVRELTAALVMFAVVVQRGGCGSPNHGGNRGIDLDGNHTS